MISKISIHQRPTLPLAKLGIICCILSILAAFIFDFTKPLFSTAASAVSKCIEAFNMHTSVGDFAEYVLAIKRLRGQTESALSQASIVLSKTFQGWQEL